jgi:hypothetical protein
MAVLFNYPDREFRLWMYVPTHSKLLLRSGLETSGISRIDILFTSVSWVSLPLVLDGMKVETWDPAWPTGELERWMGPSFDTTGLMMFQGKNYKGFVRAEIIQADESNLLFRDLDIWGVVPPV